MLADYTVPGGLLVHQRSIRELEPRQQVQFSCSQAIFAAVGRAADKVMLPGTELDVRTAVVV